jgi:hypothetical protein
MSSPTRPARRPPGPTLFRGIHASLYLTPSPAALMQPQPVAFASIQLNGFRLQWQKRETARSRHRAIPCTSALLASRRPQDTLHRVHASGRPGRRALWPVGSAGARHLSYHAWSTGENVVDQYEILVSFDVPSGEYRLLGLYDLPVAHGWQCLAIRVKPWETDPDRPRFHC